MIAQLRMVKFGEHGWPKLNQHPLPLLFHRRGEEQGIPSFLSDPLPFPICPSYFPNIHMMPSPPHFPPPATPLQGFSTLLPLPYPSTSSSPLHLLIPPIPLTISAITPLHTLPPSPHPLLFCPFPTPPLSFPLKFLHFHLLLHLLPRTLPPYLFSLHHWVMQMQAKSYLILFTLGKQQK